MLPHERAPGRHPEPTEEDGGLRDEGHLRARLQLQHLRLPLHHQLLQQQGRRHRRSALRGGGRATAEAAAGDVAPEDVGAAVGPAAAAAAPEQPAAGPQGAGDEEALDAKEDDAASLKYVLRSEMGAQVTSTTL